MSKRSSCFLGREDQVEKTLHELAKRCRDASCMAEDLKGQGPTPTRSDSEAVIVFMYKDV